MLAQGRPRSQGSVVLQLSALTDVSSCTDRCAVLHVGLFLYSSAVADCNVVADIGLVGQNHADSNGRVLADPDAGPDRGVFADGRVLLDAGVVTDTSVVADRDAVVYLRLLSDGDATSEVGTFVDLCGRMDAGVAVALAIDVKLVRVGDSGAVVLVFGDTVPVRVW